MLFLLFLSPLSKVLNTNSVNIITLEDPVEVRLPGLNQVEMDAKTTFASALRTVLRQDPTIVSHVYLSLKSNSILYFLEYSFIFLFSSSVNCLFSAQCGHTFLLLLLVH